MVAIITTPVTTNRRITVPPKIATLLGGIDTGDVIIFSYDAAGRITIEKSAVEAS